MDDYVYLARSARRQARISYATRCDHRTRKEYISSRRSASERSRQTQLAYERDFKHKGRFFLPTNNASSRRGAPGSARSNFSRANNTRTPWTAVAARSSSSTTATRSIEHSSSSAEKVSRAPPSLADVEDFGTLARAAGVESRACVENGRIKIVSFARAINSGSLRYGQLLVSHLLYTLACELDRHLYHTQAYNVAWSEVITGDMLNESLSREIFAARKRFIGQRPVEEPNDNATPTTSVLQLELPAHSACKPFPLYPLHSHAVVVERRSLNRSERSHPMLVGKGADARPTQNECSVVDSLAVFKHNLHVLTHGMLDRVQLDCTSLVLAGSVVLAALLPLPKELAQMRRELCDYNRAVWQLRLPPELIDHIERVGNVFSQPLQAYEAQLRKHYDEGPFGDADIDLFLIGDSLEKVRSQVETVVAQVKAQLEAQGHIGSVKLVATPNTVTLIAGAPYRPVQMVLLVSRSLDELLTFCDLDCTAFAYDGSEVFATQRAVRAVNTHSNLVEPGVLRRPRQAHRLIKYANRGFSSLCFEVCKHEPRCDVVCREAVDLGLLSESYRAMNEVYSSTSVLAATIAQRVIRDWHVRLRRYWADTPEVVLDASKLAGQRHVPDEDDLELEYAFGPHLRFERDTHRIVNVLNRRHGFAVGDDVGEVWRGSTFKWNRLVGTGDASVYLPSCYMCMKRVTPECVPHQTYAEDGDTLSPMQVPVCHECAALNAHKRNQKVDLHGKTAVVTGARIKIGYAIAVRLLRLGAQVIATTRFPTDARTRYRNEPDYADWADRLALVEVDFRFVEVSIGRIVDALGVSGRVDILINNAAQTIRRPAGYYLEQAAREEGYVPVSALPGGRCVPPLTEKNGNDDDGDSSSSSSSSSWEMVDCDDALTSTSGHPTRSFTSNSMALTQHSAAQLATMPLCDEDYASLEKHNHTQWFPAGRVDRDGVPVDLRRETSWNRGLFGREQVSFTEMLEVQLINVIAPTMLMETLVPRMMGRAEPGFVVNVTSPEGSFGGRAGAEKTGEHVHTNMAKSALNQLTRSTATQLAPAGVFVTAVDTGWVSRQRPGVPTRWSKTPPLSNEDGAARVLDPVLDGYKSVARGDQPESGVLLRNFQVDEW